jgi:hypothetical protein
LQEEEQVDVDMAAAEEAEESLFNLQDLFQQELIQ